MMPGDGNNAGNGSATDGQGAGNGSATDGQGIAESTQGDAEQNRAIAGRWQLMAAASQVKTAALEGGGVLGQTLSFPSRL